MLVIDGDVRMSRLVIFFFEFQNMDVLRSGDHVKLTLVN